MKNKTHTALEMIAKGHPVEMVMEIVGLDPEEMLEILMENKVHIIEFVLQEIKSEMLGTFDVSIN
jgi:hypothetical protein